MSSADLAPAWSYTGGGTFFGQLADEIAGREPTAFDRGIDRFTLMMIRFMAVMAGRFLINGSPNTTGSSAVFAVAVAVGLTPGDAADDRHGQPGARRNRHGAQQGRRKSACRRSRISAPWTFCAPTRRVR